MELDNERGPDASSTNFAQYPSEAVESMGNLYNIP